MSVEEGSIFLGVAVGGAAFMKEHSSAISEKIMVLLEKLGQLDSSLAKFLILRASFGACRINHLLRALPFVVGKALSVDMDRLFRSAFVDCVGEGSDASHFNLACLPSFSGGLGLRDPERVHEAAFLSSVFTYAAGSEDIPQCFWADVTEAWESTRET